MAALPLLVFPKAKSIAPPKGNGFPPSKPHLPGHATQSQRLKSQLADLQGEFSRYKASVSGAVAGLEPEAVIVIETAGSVDDFKRAVDATNGLEWLGEWDVEDIEPDDDFYESPKIGVDFFKNKIERITTRAQSKEIQEILQQHDCIDGDGKLIVDVIPPLTLPDHLSHLSREIADTISVAKNKKLGGRLFLSFTNEQGMRELLSLWNLWEEGKPLPDGKAKWREVFDL